MTDQATVLVPDDLGVEVLVFPKAPSAISSDAG